MDWGLFRSIGAFSLVRVGHRLLLIPRVRGHAIVIGQNSAAKLFGIESRTRTRHPAVASPARRKQIEPSSLPATQGRLSSRRVLVPCSLYEAH